MAKKKWKPVHQICIEELSQECLGSYEVEKWASVYGAGAIAPPDVIPELIRCLAKAGKRMCEMKRIPPKIKKATDNLRAQLKEINQKVS